MSIGIPAPQSNEDAAASISTIAHAAQAAQVALSGAQNAIAHNNRMMLNGEVHYASFIERMAKTDPVEAAAINNITSPSGGNHDSKQAAILAALQQIAASIK